MELAVEQGYHKAAIAGAASHTCLRRDAFIEVCVYAWKGGEVLLEQLVGPDHKILLFVAFDIDVGDFQVHWEHFESVGDGYGIEHGL